MKFQIANDVHLWSKHATHAPGALTSLITEQYRKGIPTILNGDISDMANVEKDLVEFARRDLKHLAHFVVKCGGHFVRGNHELNQVDAPDFAIVDDVLFIHGDLGVLWPLEKAVKYRSKKPGAGFLKRAITPIYDHLRQFKPWEPTDLFYRAVDDIIKYNKPRAIVMGHTHPPENIDFMYRNTRILILKRGVQILDI